MSAVRCSNFSIVLPLGAFEINISHLFDREYRFCTRRRSARCVGLVVVFATWTVASRPPWYFCIKSHSSEWWAPPPCVRFAQLRRNAGAGMNPDSSWVSATIGFVGHSIQGWTPPWVRLNQLRRIFGAGLKPSLLMSFGKPYHRSLKTSSTHWLSSLLSWALRNHVAMTSIKTGAACLGYRMCWACYMCAFVRIRLE